MNPALGAPALAETGGLAVSQLLPPCQKQSFAALQLTLGLIMDNLSWFSFSIFFLFLVNCALLTGAGAFQANSTLLAQPSNIPFAGGTLYSLVHSLFIWLRALSYLVRSLLIPHQWHLLLSPLYDVLVQTEYFLQEYNPGNLSSSSVHCILAEWASVVERKLSFALKTKFGCSSIRIN